MDVIIFVNGLIPLGTVDYNQVPDCVAGPKALDSNHYRQPTLVLHYLCLSKLCRVRSCDFFVPRQTPYSCYQYRETVIVVVVDTTFNVFSYVAAWPGN